MNPDHFGDSYDLVKRFFIEVLKSEGYTVYVDPVFTGNYAEMEDKYYLLIRAKHKPAGRPRSKMPALFIDPDKGISEKETDKHVTIQKLVELLSTCQYTLIMVFDQSYRRVKNPSKKQQMSKKLSDFSDKHVFGFFFKSHANFFFGSLDKNLVAKHRRELIRLGIPSNRFYPTKKHKKRDCSRSL